MMDAPTCRLCEEKHWPRAGCAANRRPPINQRRAEERQAQTKPCVPCAEKAARLAMLERELAEIKARPGRQRAAIVAAADRKPPKRDRAAYMREYRSKQA
jgi:hypothetical protein